VHKILPYTKNGGILTDEERKNAMVSEKFKEAYWKFRNREITSLREFGVYLGHSNYYHKCIYKFSEEYEKSPEYKEDLAEHLKENPYMRGEITDKTCFNEKSRGRKGIKGITEKFKETYWRYENYEISPSEAYEITGYSKNWFHKTSMEYEATPQYEEELKAHPSVLSKPSRSRPVPDGFKIDMKTMTDRQLADKYGICITGIKRLKKKTDRKEVWKEIKSMKQKK